MAKRLERGTFIWPRDIDGARRKLVIKPTALAMLTNPHFPALRSGPTAGSGPTVKSKFLAAHLPGPPGENH